ncbi:16S rRNA (cytidine(1402)-2'-O)-methyltransferase [Tropicimonas isoalkanivorans]|uniref:Ribosomal RNA small subunit methyltransferase I n=1 Tax=Tropicimonas isoalkanivorans TaxID=441112 RepID=A0A1I1JEK5_9RHOB|nr:16S rRNA (cytidine(1402)-2'-O)-methyltransferase [Tropicimonas isoalkanivorans]SFC46422.1 16S rRNA (cytidine1402-2'-O)-methyltransferase [Tropicimonas isoalkanivorans]
MSDTDHPAVFKIVDLPAGFHFVATPIGTARDITLRALDILASADVIAAEDTRTVRHLMELHGVPIGGRPLVAYHDHNGAAQRPRLLRMVEEGKSVAYASEAGTPLVADPGYQLGRAAIDAGLFVTCAPGPSSVLTALTLSGLPSDRFLFAGFPPAAAGARKKWLEGMAASDATLVLFDSPKRVSRLLAEMSPIFGGDRQAALCREMTKRFEEVLRGTIDDLIARLAETAPRGEIVLVVDRMRRTSAEPADVDAALKDALERLSVKEAAAEVAAQFGVARREAYQRALQLRKGGTEE